ncbi:MAG TPA: prolipoprotein diacylglyceryl transferase family protein [Burkholderiaceae bacterium]|nr:prolipoprotein diacylglyceryl transferase family protein [Burkholderiaceae bacterium]
MPTLSIGPFSFPLLLLVGVVAIILGLMVTVVSDNQRPRRAESLLSRWLIIAVVAGRIAFVSQYASIYQDHPWSMLDLRDGGFSLPWALAILLVGVTLTAWRRPATRRALLAGTFAGISVLGMGYAGAHLWGNQQGMELPELTLSTLDGSRVPLSQFHGKPAVINLWATWCPPCRREMPVLAHGQKQHGNLHFIFANQREASETIRDYLDDENLDLDNILIDAEGKLAQSIQSNGLPTTIFLDASGHVVDIRIGELSEATLNDRIQALVRNGQTLPAQE